jgi:hypothetical protein
MVLPIPMRPSRTHSIGTVKGKNWLGCCCNNVPALPSLAYGATYNILRLWRSGLPFDFHIGCFQLSIRSFGTPHQPHPGHPVLPFARHKVSRCLTLGSVVADPDRPCKFHAALPTIAHINREEGRDVHGVAS